MTREEAEMRIKAAAYAVASDLGWREAIKLLNKAAKEIEGLQWAGSNNR